MKIRHGLVIPSHEIQLTASRSSGPGGQNVNKTNTKITLRWNLNESALSDSMKTLLGEKLSQKLTLSDEIVLSSDRHRDQSRNRADCIAKFKDLILKATARKRKRVKTQPTSSSKKKRLESKKKHSEKKKSRQKVSH